MDKKPSDYIIRQGLDDDDYFLLWPMSEWLIAIAPLGVLVAFHHVLLGLGVFMLILYGCMKFRGGHRGSKTQVLWRLNLWTSKKGLQFAPPAHATRLDN